jgi:hypothetical protein
MSQDCRRLNAEKSSLSGPSSIGGDDLQEVLKPGKTLQVTPDYDNHTAVFDRVERVADHQKVVIDEGLSWIRQVTSEAGLPKMDVRFARVTKDTGFRGSFAVKEGIALQAHAKSGVVVHEFAHHLENHTGAGHAAQDFLKYRVGDETPTSLATLFPKHGYGREEMGRKDKFEEAFGDAAWYVGKDYGKHGTEITSMGLEKLYADPVGFAKKDPEHVSFLLGILDGSLR